MIIKKYYSLHVVPFHLSQENIRKGKAGLGYMAFQRKQSQF